MPRYSTSAARESQPLPFLAETLHALTVDELKWYAAALPGKTPTRKADIVEKIEGALLELGELRLLVARLTAEEKWALAMVVHTYEGRYVREAVEAKYPHVKEPIAERASHSYYYGYGYGSREKRLPSDFELFFYYNYSANGRYVPSDVALLLRMALPPPPPSELPSSDEPPVLEPTRKQPQPPEVMLTHSEASVFHDITATLSYIGQGKVSVGANTGLPTLPTARALKGKLLMGDYFEPEGADYARAEDAVRPLALVMLAQAAKWAAPATSKGSKLELTRRGQEALGEAMSAKWVREAWERWLKTDLLDELSRVKAIKGQQSSAAQLTKPATRRATIANLLRACPPGRWVTFDELLRYMRAEGLVPLIEENMRYMHTALHVGYGYYDNPGYDTKRYWDIIAGSYVRAVVFEYAATLGMVELAYTAPEDSPHEFGSIYYLDEPYLSRYDGLLALRLTNLGAYALGLADEYKPSAEEEAKDRPPVMRVLPNLEVVITDVHRLLPNERALLERIATPQSEHVYRLSRDQLLEAAQNGVTIEQAQSFLAAKSGLAHEELPNTVLVFLADTEKRLNLLRDRGRMVVLESDDPYLLAELSTSPGLRNVARLGTIGKQSVLLIPESHEQAARKQLKKLGYAPKREK